MTKVNLSHLIDTDAKDYAIYTVENRAIPNVIDGLKPVQRFVLYRALELRKGGDKFYKLASIAGGVADAGYHHGEASAQDAGVIMANTWNNNYPILKGQGNFGSRLVKEAAASRYIFCAAGKNFDMMYKDHEVAPEHKDPEHLPPRFYLPVIPTVLLNGIQGIATGYATNILPHSVESVIECTKLAINGKLDKEPVVAYPNFRGNIVQIDTDKFEIQGTYELVNRKLTITEVPYKFDRETYVNVLESLVDKNLISYNDNCSKLGFNFSVTLKKDYVLPTNKDQLHDKIMRDFKLLQTVSQNIVVIDETGKLNNNLKSASSVIRHFVGVRSEYINDRISLNRKTLSGKLADINARISFITLVIDGKIVLKNKKRVEVLEELNRYEEIKDYSGSVIQMPIYQMTKDEIEKLIDKRDGILKELKYWETTTAKKEYLKDISDLSSYKIV